MMLLLLGGAEPLKRTYLGLLSEARLASFCLTEPDAGSDPSALAATARRNGEGWVVTFTGRKCLITNASHAHWYTVFARTSD